MSVVLLGSANRPLIISVYLVILITVLLTTAPVVFSQELEERLHTNWAIMRYEVIPQNPAAGKEAILRAEIGIASIIEPLPQEVEVMLKIDGKQYRVFFLTFERDPNQVQIAQASWTASPGRHRIEWIIDPSSRYDDPDTENNYAAFDIEITPVAEAEKITTTITVTETIVSTMVEEVTAPAGCPECPEISPITELVTMGETKTVILETARTKTITETTHRPFTVTEKITETSTTRIIEVERHLDYLPLGVLGGASALVAGILGLILGRRFSGKMELPPLGMREKLPKTAVFLGAIYRLARKLNEDEWEAKPGEYVPETEAIVTVDEEGNVTIVSDHRCLYSSEIFTRPLLREDLEAIDRRVLEGLLDQLKSTRETTKAMELGLNDKQRQAIEEVIQRMEEERSRRERIQ